MISNAYKHGTSVDVFESASERRGADGIDLLQLTTMKPDLPFYYLLITHENS
jgi:hypothetical protein